MRSRFSGSLVSWYCWWSLRSSSRCCEAATRLASPTNSPLAGTFSSASCAVETSGVNSVSVIENSWLAGGGFQLLAAPPSGVDAVLDGAAHGAVGVACGTPGGAAELDGTSPEAVDLAASWSRGKIGAGAHPQGHAYQKTQP